MKIKIKINIPEVEKEIKNKMTSKMKKYGEIILETTKKNCPVKTGRLRNSLFSFINENDVIIGSEVFYSQYVEQKTGFFTKSIEEAKNKIRSEK